LKHTNRSIRELIKKANKKGWKDSELNKQVIEANVTGVTDMSELFEDMSQFNLDISNWDVSSVTNMRYMFSSSNFNQDIGAWDVSSVRDMRSIFSIARNFNQDIGSWNVSNVTDMKSMFYRAKNFNQDIGSWDVSSVTNMQWIFGETQYFNQNIGSWDVSSVTDMEAMFAFSRNFNQDISTWNVSSVKNMGDILLETKEFNQDLTIWQAFNDSLDESVLKYCEDLTSAYINNYLSKKELELREELTSGVSLTKNADKIKQYKLLSNFKAIKDKLQAVDIKSNNLQK
jgi:surface protein